MHATRTRVSHYLYMLLTKSEVLKERVVIVTPKVQGSWSKTITRASLFSLRIAFRPTPWTKSVFITSATN